MKTLCNSLCWYLPTSADFLKYLIIKWTALTPATQLFHEFYGTGYKENNLCFPFLLLLFSFLEAYTFSIWTILLVLLI